MQESVCGGCGLGVMSLGYCQAKPGDLLPSGLPLDYLAPSPPNCFRDYPNYVAPGIHASTPPPHRHTDRTRMAASLHQIARGGVVEEGENFFREVTDSKGEQAANAVDGMQR